MSPAATTTYTLTATNVTGSATATANVTVIPVTKNTWPHLLDLNGDRLGDVFLYNKATGDRRFELTNAGGSTEISSAWDPGWQIYPAKLNADAARRSDR